MTKTDKTPEPYGPPANPGEPPVGDAGPSAPEVAPLPSEARGRRGLAKGRERFLARLLGVGRPPDGEHPGRPR